MKRVTLFSTFPVAIVVLTGIAVGLWWGCAKGKGTGAALKSVFAEFRGEVMHENQPVIINRRLWVSATGDQRAVVSDISSVADLGSYKVSSTRRLLEFRCNDSLYIFDTADSMMVVLSMEEMKLLEADFVPFTANWLLKDWPLSGDIEGSNAETDVVAGMPCDLFEVGGKVYSLFNGLPLAVMNIDARDGYREELVRITADTVLPDLCFRFPSGFRRIAPAGKQ